MEAGQSHPGSRVRRISTGFAFVHGEFGHRVMTGITRAELAGNLFQNISVSAKRRADVQARSDELPSSDRAAFTGIAHPLGTGGSPARIPREEASDEGEAQRSQARMWSDIRQYGGLTVQSVAVASGVRSRHSPICRETVWRLRLRNLKRIRAVPASRMCEE